MSDVATYRQPESDAKLKAMPTPWPSLVIPRQLLLRIALVLIVVNPQLRMLLRHDCRYLVHGLERGLLVPVIVGHVAMLEACLKMHSIAAKNHRSSFWEPHEQRLMAGRVSRRGEQHEAPVAKNIVVAVDEFYRMLLVKGDSILPAPSPFVLDSGLWRNQAGCPPRLQPYFGRN